MKYLDRKINGVEKEQDEKTSARKMSLKKSFENKKEAISQNRSGYVRYQSVENLRGEGDSDSNDELMSIDSAGNLREPKSPLGISPNNRLSPAKT